MQSFEMRAGRSTSGESSDEEPVVAIDFETYYDRECSVRTMGTEQYVRHERFDPYMVAICCGPGHPLNYTGLTKDYHGWAKLPRARWVSHNAAFDSAVYREMRRRGMLPPDAPEPDIWDCTADMASYLQFPRSLADASRVAFKYDADKSVRSDMLGKLPRDLDNDAYEALVKYAKTDALLCWQLWRYLSKRWPEHERELSRHTRRIGARGLRVDEEYLRRCIQTLKQELHAALCEIPWCVSDGSMSPLSRTHLRTWCVDNGIAPPKSVAKDSEDLLAWEAKYASHSPVVRAVGRYRSINAQLKKYEAVEARVFDGIMPFALSYYGARVTGRWSGAGGVNLQNLPRDEMFGCHMRRLFVPHEPGAKFFVADFSQIEPRVLAWLSGNEALLDELRSGKKLYQIHAEQTMGHPVGVPLPKSDPVYRLAKARVLALGYGAGHKRFVSMARALAGLEIDEEQSKDIVDDFRDKETHTVALWSDMDHRIMAAALYHEQPDGSYQKQSLRVPLPSGRVLVYRDVERGAVPGRSPSRSYGARFVLDPKQKHKPIYGALLVENMVQAVARDFLANAILRLEHAGFRVCFHVHDEVVIEGVSTSDEVEAILSIMRTPPPWAPSDFPLDVSWTWADSYADGP